MARAHREYNCKGVSSRWPCIPYLFIIATDILSRNIKVEVRERTKIEGLWMKHGCPELNHMFFADAHCCSSWQLLKMRATLRQSLINIARHRVNELMLESLAFFQRQQKGRKHVWNWKHVRRPKDQRPRRIPWTPNHAGRIKERTLGCHKSRTMEKLHGWNTCMLNNAGREVLIKVVIMEIPNYAMSVFKLSTTYWLINKCYDCTVLVGEIEFRSKDPLETLASDNESQTTRRHEL